MRAGVAHAGAAGVGVGGAVCIQGQLAQLGPGGAVTEVAQALAGGSAGVQEVLFSLHVHGSNGAPPSKVQAVAPALQGRIESTPSRLTPRSSLPAPHLARVGDGGSVAVPRCTGGGGGAGAVAVVEAAVAQGNTGGGPHALVAGGGADAAGCAGIAIPARRLQGERDTGAQARLLQRLVGQGVRGCCSPQHTQHASVEGAAWQHGRYSCLQHALCMRH